MTIYNTTFSTDENPLQNDGTAGLVWTPGPGITIGLQVVGGLAYPSAAAVDATGRYDATTIGASQFAEVTSAPGWLAGGSLHAYLRLQPGDAITGYRFDLSLAGSARILEGIDAAYGVNASATAAIIGARTAGDILRAKAQGPCLALLINGVVRITAVDSTYLTGQPGIGADASTTPSTQQMTAASVGDLPEGPGPLILDAAVSSNPGNVTTFTITVPPVSSGDRLLVCVGKDGSGAVTWPGSPAWSAITNAAGADGAGASYLDARYRNIDGTEGWSGGGSFAVTGASEAWKAVAYRLTGHDAAAAPECTAATIAGTSTTPDPPSLTPSWGALNTLWLAVIVTDANPVISVWPTNYTEWAVGMNGAAAGDCGLACAGRWLNATSDDPSAFTIGLENWRALTLAIKPAAAVVLPPRPTQVAFAVTRAAVY